MKNIKILLLIIISAFVSFSCKNDDGGDSALVLETGAVPNMIKEPGSDVIIDLVRLTSGEVLSISFSVDVAQGSPVSTDVIAAFVTSEGPVYTATLASNVSLPGVYTVTSDDIIAAFSEINSIEDIKLGDVLRISTRFTMPDGRILSLLNDDGTDNTGTTLSNSKLVSVVINYPVSCPTMLEGNYISTVIASSIDIPTNFRSPQPVVITQPSAGTYILSDGTADIFGPDFPIGLTFTDVCETITVAAPSVDFPGAVDFIDNGATLDPITGIIIMNLEYTSGSCCNLPGIKWTLELTPVP